MAKRRLPIGIQTFRKVREGNHYYVDKTGYALRLVDEGTHFFLSRPRRFGKSLFVDTLKHLFEGHQALFEGLAAYDHWDWSVRYPVVRLDFSGGDFQHSDGVRISAEHQLGAMERAADTRRFADTAPERLRDLLSGLHSKTGQRVCVLVDEYDKPILDCLEDPQQARANRDYLRSLYGMIKSCDEDIRFVFLTGVTKLSKASLFSGLNNLNDITLDERYAAICGYTESDLDTVFSAELPGLDREQIREWYNGYRWAVGAESVYSPWDVLLLFDKRAFTAWWFETGTPSFLIQTLIERDVSLAGLDGMPASKDDLGRFDVGSIAPEALLFQTGYLTLGGQQMYAGEQCYRLVYPNREVRQSLTSSLLSYLTGSDPQRRKHRSALHQLLENGDLSGLEQRIRAMYDSIPYQWHVRNEIARYEAYYASVFFGYFCGLEVEMTVEDSSNRGRLDMAVRAGGRIYLFEFKLVEQSGPGAALAQLKERGYADKYRHLGQPIHLIGVEFSSKTRTLSRFQTELA